jgi:peroxiredoxin
MQNVVQLRRKAKARQEQLEALAPKVGEMAPDFELRDVNGQNPVRLSAFRGQKPVALIFGSFT